ncbi:potassium voltage-gated channel subfamily C member 1-like [Rana temporaria]|uniref:potassium voltage-gated channel subfamily C member 1-like n=1 Tax=Rana temporaria TaxID=8407 RepID=UPI001AAD133E|nr:potassium voltage-gated channel subfamily C member 1-like [Rana temporaria]
MIVFPLMWSLSLQKDRRLSGMDSSSRRVVINVGGVRFETFASTLLTFPGTKLSALAEPSPGESGNYDPQRGEFFFDRNPEVFGSVLDYYRTKHLHCSGNMCRAVLLEELAFWGVSFARLSHCCWLNIYSKSQAVEDVSSWDQAGPSDEQILLQTGGPRDRGWGGRWRPKVWNLFHKPRSSLAAMGVTAISLLFIIGAIIIYFEETKPHFSHAQNKSDSWEYDPSVHMEVVFEIPSYLFYLELFCVFWFGLELATRFFFCPNRNKFLKSPLNWVDFLSLFPVFVELMARGPMEKTDNVWKVLGLIRIVYILKLFRLVRLMESSLVLRVLSGTLRAITREIFILMLILALECLLFAALAFHLEWSSMEDPNSHEVFKDIYSSCWWAIITLTTVGYGDLYPITTAGRIVASLAAISGILTIVLPIPILMIKFQHYYSIALAKEKLKLQKML